MVDELDASIGRLLGRELAKDLYTTPIGISFANPASSFPPDTQPLPVINFFLYDLRPNLGMRRNDRSIERCGNGAVRIVPAPVPMDASYLVSVWTDPKTESATADEHRIFSAVLQVLMAHSTLPAEDLGESLKSAGAPACAVGPGLLQSPEQTQRILGGQQKLTTSYTVTFAMPVTAPEDATLVTDTRIELALLQGPNQ